MSKTELKIYEVLIKYVGVTLHDGDKLIHEAYSPLPKGHSIEKELVKLSLKDAVSKIKNAKGSDDLVMDYSGSTAYSPSDVKKVYWTDNEDMARNMCLIDITGVDEKYKEGDSVDVGKNRYVCVKVIDWMANFRVKFIYARKIDKPVEVEKVVEEAEEIKGEPSVIEPVEPVENE